MIARASLIAATLLAPAAAVGATPITGRWTTADGSGIVTVGPCGGTVCGRLTQILKSQPGAPKTDVANSDPALRTRPILGMPILSGFVDKGNDWRGTIYDPRNGKSYRSVVRLKSASVLEVKGCIGPLCQAQEWTRAK